MNEITKQFSVKELFSNDSYVIPIYQRNYAWRNPEITQLIQDIVDYIKKDNLPIKEKPNYYIGTLIVYERKDGGTVIYETIDGQQRLTTLTILLSIIKNLIGNKDTDEDKNIDITWYRKLNLKFDSRLKSTDTLQHLFDGKPLEGREYNVAIKQGYEDAKKALKKILEDFNLGIVDFCNYLFEKVNILRVLVPHDTDLNHYFEIMNSRGEQLEKHEILKAKCIEILDEKDRYAFSIIWDACSNMEKYVQYGFNSEHRGILFGNNGDNKWNKLIEYGDLYERMNNTNKDNKSKKENKLTIEELLNTNTEHFSEQQDSTDDIAERFNSVINFSNFLLHILRIQIKEDIALDDKRLLELFDPYLKKSDNKEFVKQFGYNLLKGKFLFDKYIIKREFSKGADQWSLKQLKWYEKNASYVNTFKNNEKTDDENREILMLLSMFHVSNPTLVYKHWLNAALYYLFKNDNITATNYKKYLEELAKAFLYDRFIATKPKNYFDIIYNNNAKSTNSEIDISKLNQGTNVENFIFNYLDYLLWQNYRNGKEYFKIEESDKPFKDDRIKDFEYTFRSSVEHYYPQNPYGENLKIEEQWLNHFGNLCLISTSKNSRLSNYMPKAKKEHYQNSPTIDSIKQRIMMEYEEWYTMGNNNKNEIEDHGKKMIQILKRL